MTPVPGESVVRAALSLTLGAALALHAAPAPSPAAARIEINRASATQLTLLPGVGPGLARRIVEARAARPFRSVDDLVVVRGIGPRTLAGLRDWAVVSRRARAEPMRFCEP